MTRKKIKSLACELERNKCVDFEFNSLFYSIYESSVENGFVVNIYKSDVKDENDDYLEDSLIDGGFCTGNELDAVEFMI